LKSINLKTFPILLDSELDVDGSFLIMGITGFMVVVTLFIFLKETKGLSLEQRINLHKT